MKHFIVLLLVFCAVTAIAQVPSGTFNYAFTNTPLWDVTGIYTNNTDANDIVIADIQQEAAGQITGLRTETYVNGADQAEGSGPITGKTFVKAGTVGASLKSSEGITGVSGGEAFTAKASFKETATLVPSTLTILDNGTVRECVIGGKCETVTEAVSFPLPAGMNGDWALDTNVAANGNKLTGTGTLTLSNGRVLSYQITGSYNASSQVAKLKLVGEGDATKTSLSVTTQGTNMVVTALKGKVLGQTPTFP